MTSCDEKEQPVTDELDDYIQEVPSHTPDFKTQLAEELARLVPEAIADGKVDVEKLRELLSDDAANDGRERFGLMWPGKSRALKAAQAQTTATLVPYREASKDWDTTQNVFIEGDNLEVLKILQKHYHGKIKMIYIDPPYNTGNDFIYPDNFREGLSTYLEWTNQVSGEGAKLSSNPESAGRYHSNWLNMMYPRLKLARNLLTDDGVIFVSIDGVELSNLKLLMREIFGEANEVGDLIHQRAKGGGQARHIVKGHDNVLVFAKDLAQAAPLVRPKVVQNKTVLIEDVEHVRDDDVVRRSFGKYDRSHDRRCFYEELEELKGKKKKLEIDQKLASGELVLEPHPENGMNVIVRYTPVSQATSKLYSIVTALSELGQQDLVELGMERYFDYPKSVDFMLQVLRSATLNDKGAYVLDFFSGSATTAHGVMALNAEDGGSRRSIQVQLPEPLDAMTEAGKAGYANIAEVARGRLRHAGEKVKEAFAEHLASRQSPLDVGYRSYALEDTNFMGWRETSEISHSALEQRLAGLRGSAKDDASPEALLTELLLKQGFSLSEQIAQTEIAGLPLWSVAGGSLLAIMDEHVKPSLDQLRAVVEAGAVRLVVLEDVFAGDDQLKTNLVQHAKTHGVELWSA
jgi:adenine-specific DNA-methyltransferase